MSQHRYHIHVCLVKNEQPELENALQIALADSYFLTWDLNGTPANFMDYTRKQIDRCDYVLFVLGDSYGNLSPSGVSYLHLSYVYATTKRKTLFTLIKQAELVTLNNDTHARQRGDFAGTLEKDQTDYTTFYGNDLESAMSQCLFNLKQLIERFPKAGWVKSAKLNLEANERLFKPNKSLNLPKTNEPSNKDSLFNERLVQSSVQSSVKDSWLSSSTAKPSISPFSSSATKTTATTVTAESGAEPLALEDTVTVQYTAHAYKDGNLTDLTLTQALMWLDIVVSLRKLKEPFTSDMMQRNLNHLLNGYALTSAKKIQPNTHAVARAQINANDFETIKQQLVAQDWLTAVKPIAGVQRDLWQLSDELK